MPTRFLRRKFSVQQAGRASSPDKQLRAFTSGTRRAELHGGVHGDGGGSRKDRCEKREVLGLSGGPPTVQALQVPAGYTCFSTPAFSRFMRVFTHEQVTQNLQSKCVLASALLFRAVNASSDSRI